MGRSIIVGIDPGTTVGICILDFRGNLVKLCSKRNFSVKNIVKFISDFGNVVVVATDVHKIPAAISKISAEIGAVIFSPEQDIEKYYKIKTSREFVSNKNEDIKIKNAHERAALTAALLAYCYYKNKINQAIKKAMEHRLYGEDVDKVLALVLKKVSISNAIRKCLSK